MTADVVLPTEPTIVVLPNLSSDVVISEAADVVVLGSNEGTSVILGSEEVLVVLTGEGPRGLQGAPAKIGLAFDVAGQPPPNFVLGRFVCPGDQVFVDTACFGVSEAPAHQETTYSVQVDTGTGYSTVGSVIFHAGSRRALFTFNAGRIALKRGDVFRVVTSAVPDATLSSPTLTFAGD